MDEPTDSVYSAFTSRVGKLRRGLLLKNRPELPSPLRKRLMSHLQLFIVIKRKIKEIQDMHRTRVSDIKVLLKVKLKMMRLLNQRLYLHLSLAKEKSKARRDGVESCRNYKRNEAPWSSG